jgi:hypothetical protein
MRIKDILEARKNPEQNPKTSVNDVIYDEFLKMKGDKSGGTIAGVTNLFVSFTAIPKLGINPGSTYNTPNGIYAYPAEYVMKVAGTDDPMNMLPFAGDQPWVNLFTVANNVINVRTLNKTDYKMYINDLEKKFVESGIMSSNKFKVIVDNADTDAARADYWGGQLWYVTMKIAEYLTTKRGGQRNNNWNAVWRRIGIVGAVDTGAGIIHEGEPTQAVFFDPREIDVLTRVANKYSPEKMRYRQRLGFRQADKRYRQLEELRTFLQTKPSVADLMDWLNQTADRWDLFPRLPKEYRHRMLSKFSHYLTFFPGGKIPREDYLAALTNNPLQTLDLYASNNKLQKWYNFVNQQQLAAILENWRLKNPTYGKDNYTKIWELMRSIVNPNSFRIDKTFKMHPDLAKVLLKFNPEIIIEIIQMNNSPEIIDFARQVAEEQNNFSALRFINNIGKQQS